MCVIFALLDPDPDPDLLTRLNPDLIRIRVRNPDFVGNNFVSWIRIQPKIINYADPNPKPWETSSILCCNLVIEGLKFIERNAVMLMLRSRYTDCTHTFK